MNDMQDMTPQQEAEAIRAAQREYSRKYRAENKERVKEWNRRYWLRRAQRAAQDGGGQDGT